MPPKLHIIITSTRDERVGTAVANWFIERAREHGKFEIEVVDLKELKLPLLDEPHHPMQRRYQYGHTKAWSKSVEAADAFVFVLPEYNYGMPPALLNALDYLYVEWNYKAAGFCSYGGASGGMRSVQMTKQMLTTLKMVPLNEAVTVHFVAKRIDAEKKFLPEESHPKAAATMLDELLRWTTALRTLRPTA
jgi:NAD(P)H-dependent FMN reductase